MDNKTYCQCGHTQLAHNWRTGCLVGGCQCVQFCGQAQAEQGKDAQGCVSLEKAKQVA